MTKKHKGYKMNIDEALVIAREILMRGQDVELRATKSGEILIYEVNKKARRPPALHETGG